MYRESPFPFLIQQTTGAFKIRFWSQFQCVCVHVCVCVCTHMCAWMCKCALCVCRHTRASLHVYMCVRMCAWVCECVLWVCACVHTHLCIGVCTCVCVCVCVCVLGGCSHPSDKQCSGTSWVSYNSTPFRHCLPRHRSDPCLKVQSHKTVLPPNSDASPKPSLSPEPLTFRLWSRGSPDPRKTDY